MTILRTFGKNSLKPSRARQCLQSPSIRAPQRRSLLPETRSIADYPTTRLDTPPNVRQEEPTKKHSWWERLPGNNYLIEISASEVSHRQESYPPVYATT